jgi:hypothetical protein
MEKKHVKRLQLNSMTVPTQITVKIATYLMLSVCGNYQRKKGVFRESPQPSAHALVGIAGTGGNRSLCLCLHFKSSLAHIAY